jgi:hypothetical protein
VSLDRNGRSLYTLRQSVVAREWIWINHFQMGEQRVLARERQEMRMSEMGFGNVAAEATGQMAETTDRFQVVVRGIFFPI